MLAAIENKLQSYNGKKQVLLDEQGVSDIVRGILLWHDKYKSEYDKICVFFAGGTVRDICNRIWKFLREHVKYKVEPDSKQFLKSPAAILATGRTTGSDCKNYSLFTAGIIDALNRKGYKIPFSYRFSSYKIYDNVPQHVFVVVNPKSKNEIWVDAVLPRFDWHKEYCYSFDKKIKPMALIALSGIDDNSGIGRGGKKRRQERRAQRKKNPKRKKFFSKVKDAIQKGAKFQLKFALAPARNSFLAIVGLNVRGLASKLKIAIQKDDKGLKKFWENIGGNYTKLKNTIMKGAKKKRLLGTEAELGALPAIAAAIASATPIIIKIGNFLKKLGIKSEDIKKLGAAAAKGIAKKAVKDVNRESEGEQTASGDELQDQNGGEIPEAPEASSEDTGEGGESEDTGEGGESEDTGEGSESEDTGEGVGRMRFPVPPNRVLKPVYNLADKKMTARKRLILHRALLLKKAHPNKFPSLRDYVKEVQKTNFNTVRRSSTAAANINRLGDII